MPMPLPRCTLAGAAVALGLAASACNGGTGPAATADTSGASTVPATVPTPTEVSIRTFIFHPDPITISRGTTVTFSNSDGTTHTVTAGTRDAPQPEVIDASLAEGETTTWTPTEPGTYDYHCRLHSGPGMTGHLVVT